MPKISQHNYDIAVVAVRRDHTSGVSVLKVYRPWVEPSIMCLSLVCTNSWPVPPHLSSQNCGSTMEDVELTYII